MNEVKRLNIPREHIQEVNKNENGVKLNEHSFYHMLVKKVANSLDL